MARKTGVLKADKAEAKAQAKQTREQNVAAVAKAVNLKKVGAVASNASGDRPVFNPDAKIVVLPAGKENPRREGSARWVRYRDLVASKTVGDFLKKHPRWNATISRCVIAGLIELK